MINFKNSNILGFIQCLASPDFNVNAINPNIANINKTYNFNIVNEVVSDDLINVTWLHNIMLVSRHKLTNNKN